MLNLNFTINYQCLLIFASCKDSSGGWLRKVVEQSEGICTLQTEDTFWAGLRSNYLARFFQFSHSIYFDPITYDSLKEVGKLTFSFFLPLFTLNTCCFS